MQEEKKKAYVIYTDTLANLENTVGKSPRYDKTIFYAYEVKREPLSEEQKEIQRNNKWYAEQNDDIRISEDTIKRLVSKTMYEKIYGGCKKNVDKETFNEVINTEIKAVFTTDVHNDNRRIGLEIIFGDEDIDRYDLSDDIEEFEGLLKEVRRSTSFSGNGGEMVYLERISVGAYPYAFCDISEIINKAIKKILREELTYCFKKGEVIIPQEYLDKKEEGIKEWREMKSSNNKNNSMEKRMLRQIVRDKKNYAFNSMCQIMNKIVQTNNNWSLPSLDIEGRWNKQKTNKLVNKILKDKSNQFYIDITEEKIVRVFKDYWMKILAEASDAVDKMEVEKY